MLDCELGRAVGSRVPYTARVDPWSGTGLPVTKSVTSIFDRHQFQRNVTPPERFFGDPKVSGIY